MNGENPKIYTVFCSESWGWGGSHPPKYLLTNEEVLHKLESKCKGVDFIVRDITKPDTKLASVVNEIENLKDDLDCNDSDGKGQKGCVK